MGRLSNGWKSAGIAVAVMLSAGAFAQGFGSDSYALLQAIRAKDGGKMVELVRSRGPMVINNRGGSDEAPLHVVVRQREPSWLSYLLGNGGDPNIAASNGDTPLITAARIGYAEAAELLLANGAKVDAANRQGETALIIAVQQRSVPLVRLLLERGANPDRVDTAAGYSALDYARRDRRSADILRLIEARKAAAKPVMGPVLR